MGLVLVWCSCRRGALIKKPEAKILCLRRLAGGKGNEIKIGFHVVSWFFYMKTRSGH